MHIKNSRHIALLAVLLSTLLYSFSSIKAQDLELHMVVPEDLTDENVREYRKDAARLALSHIAAGRSLLDIDVRIPADIQESLFKALMFIYKSDDPHAKKVVGMDIHTKAKPYYIDRIEINCNPDATWIGPIIGGNTATSSTRINNKLDEYQLEITGYSKENNSFTVSARNPLNMRRLAKMLSDYDEGIDFIAVPEINETDNNIEAKDMGNDTWIITFHKGGKKWSFKVDDEGNVSYQK